MDREPPDVPAAVRSKAIAHGAQAWLAGLADLIASIETDWSITVGRPLDGGTEAFVAEATCADGTPAVLKLLVPRPGDAARNEITVLRMVNGEGCATLLRDDVERGAMLVERVSTGLLCVEIGVQPVGAQMLTVAEDLAADWR